MSDTVQSLSRGLAVIRSFEGQASMTLTQVATRIGLPRAVARRFLHTLVLDGYAVTDGKYFRLTPRILDLGFAFLTSSDLWGVAQPVMEDVVAETGESCSAAMLDGTDIVYVARVPAGRIMQVGLSVGSRLPAFCSAMGRVLLAGLAPSAVDRFLDGAELRAFTDRTITDPQHLRRTVEIVRQAGWALVDEELEAGLRSLAVPIRRPSGEVLAAMNVSVHAGAGSPEALVERCLPVLCQAAHRIARSIGPMFRGAA